MRKWSVAVVVALVWGCSGFRDAFTARVDDVARANGRQLTVARLADVLARGKSLPLRRDVVDRVATLWVEYVLYADRIVSGDSLLDSTSVVTTLWPDVQQRIADHFHEKVIGGAVKLDSAAVDSAYAAGTLRLIDHILVRASPELAPDQKAARRRQAEAIRLALQRGTPWAKENELNEDPNGKEVNGRLGVIAKGEMLAPFENVAFKLNPGELSEVTETPFGFHVIRRPPLKEVRGDFKSGVEDRLVARLDTTFLSSLEARWAITVRSGAGAALRAAASDPIQAERSSTVLATYKGGKFRVADFMPWFYSMSLQQQGQLSTVTDDNRIADYLKTLVRNEVLLKEAADQNVHLTGRDMSELKDQLSRDLSMLTAALRIDPASMQQDTAAKNPSGKAQLVAQRVDQYLDDIANDRQRFIVVPQLLSVRLRAQGRWEVVSAGVDRALQQAMAMRSSADSAQAATHPRNTPAAPIPRIGSEEPAAVQAVPAAPPAKAPAAKAPATKARGQAGHD
ncbi:MAG TPA: peptidylprolyl isomerase [Gemmatimonadales bacterium]|jgi:hypothetical protein